MLWLVWHFDNCILNILSTSDPERAIPPMHPSALDVFKDVKIITGNFMRNSKESTKISDPKRTILK